MPRQKRIRNTVSSVCIIDSSSNDSKEENSLSGPTTRKAWSDWCSNKIKSCSLNNSGQDSNEENGKLFCNALNFYLKLVSLTHISMKKILAWVCVYIHKQYLYLKISTAAAIDAVFTIFCSSTNSLTYFSSLRITITDWNQRFRSLVQKYLVNKLIYLFFNHCNSFEDVLC